MLESPRRLIQRVCVLAVAAGSMLLLVPQLQAQSQATTGVIEGTVLDESGSVLPGATVILTILTNTATNFELVLITEASGRFRGVLLPLGPYRVTTGLEGFTTLVREGIQLAVGQTINLRLTLQISATEE